MPSTIRRLTPVMLIGLGWVGMLFAQQVPSDSDREASWIAKARSGLDRRAIDTLARISGTHRQLLALRAYLRAGDTLAVRWSWSQAQLNAYPSTSEGQAAVKDVDAVEAAFARANPGYSAHANRMPRSLEQQLDHWNENPAVESVAAALTASMHQQFRHQSTPDTGQLQRALVEWKPTSAAPLAAPGLSAHGQGRAFDFQIFHNERSVAGFDAALAHQQWDAAGWTRRLHAAVVASGLPFEGPLQSPYEPWHYFYMPHPAR